jgi:hypothetical protein
MIAFKNAAIAVGVLAIAGVSGVAAADVDDGSHAFVHAHSVAMPHGVEGTMRSATVGFSGLPGEPGENRLCAGCHESR